MAYITEHVQKHWVYTSPSLLLLLFGLEIILNLTSIPAEADNSCYCVSELQFSEKGPLSCLFSQSCATIIP